MEFQHTLLYRGHLHSTLVQQMSPKSEVQKAKAGKLSKNWNPPTIPTLLESWVARQVPEVIFCNLLKWALLFQHSGKCVCLRVETKIEPLFGFSLIILSVCKNSGVFVLLLWVWGSLLENPGWRFYCSGSFGDLAWVISWWLKLVAERRVTELLAGSLE